MIPNDIVICDWYYVITGVDSKSQDYFGQRGLDVIYGNFHPSSFLNLEDRLRRPNVLGGEASLWHETSELGISLTNALVHYLDSVNILWYEGYSKSIRGDMNKLIAQIQPRERDRMNAVRPASRESENFMGVDISAYNNIPLNGIEDYSFILSSEKIPGTAPFKICCGDAAGKATSPENSCILVGHGKNHLLDEIKVGEKLKGLAFLHSYTVHLGGPPAHACSYVGPEDDIVGYYTIRYNDGSTIKIPLYYSRMIISVHQEFGAHCADPVFMESKLTRSVEKGKTSDVAAYKWENHTVFSYEWNNPYPGKEIAGISIEHNEAKQGGIVLFAVTGIR
jgi:hypothetical protein